MGTAILFSCRSRVFPFYQIPQIAQQSSASVHKGRREMCYTGSRISSYERSFVSMSQAAAQQPSRKKTVISLLVLLALTCIIVFTF